MTASHDRIDYNSHINRAPFKPSASEVPSWQLSAQRLRSSVFLMKLMRRVRAERRLRGSSAQWGKGYNVKPPSQRAHQGLSSSQRDGHG
ncbi:hypothetical protein PBY51_005591 [Eleginops maclovinus]|uniref:Uncharacterized protein n=1 Tax=Eleginops maclovinus TaxID=56733 RepID=A0AAN8AD57_ELEMC|nr:hypothetical protein PBY51_005591 [Eleginops maclovinus]